MTIRLDSGANPPGLWSPSNVGMKAWTFDPANVSGQSPVTAGALNLSMVYLPDPALITNVVLIVGSAGVTLTASQCFAALYSGAGNLVDVTADQSTAWASTGVKAMALAAGPVSLAAGYYYVGLFSNGSTQPSFSRVLTAAFVANAGTAAPNLRFATANTGLTTAMPATLGAQTASGTAYWAALS